MPECLFSCLLCSIPHLLQATPDLSRMIGPQQLICKHTPRTAVQCIQGSGTPLQATPKQILQLMNVEGLTIFHAKSHLQKIRLGERRSSGGRWQPLSGCNYASAHALLSLGVVRNSCLIPGP